MFISEDMIGYVILVAVGEATNLVPCHVVKSLQLIWRSGSYNFNRFLIDFQVSGNALTL